MDRVKGKVSIVTGGSSGIGRSTCLLFAKEGAKVAVVDIVDSAGRELVSEITHNGGMARYWHINVASEKEVKEAFTNIYEEFGQIDVLVNNAGIPGVNKPSDEVEETQWDRVLDVNAKGVFLCTKYAVPYMKKVGGGSIINICSIFGLVGGEDPPYHASKGAVRLLTKSDAYYYGKDGIRVNSIFPGFILTPLYENILRINPERSKDDISKLILGHLGEPKDAAYGILYLASDESKFVTGSEVVIDGGYTAL